MTGRDAIFKATGVYPPSVDPGELDKLSDVWRRVMRAADSVKSDVDAAVTEVLDANQDAATDAFANTTQGPQSASQRLGKLSKAASNTSQAHATAAQVITQTVDGMNDLATSAAWHVAAAARQPDPAAVARAINVIVGQAKDSLNVFLDRAREAIEQAYAAVDVPDKIELHTEGYRGALPPEIAAIWAEMDFEQRKAMLDAMAEDILKDWPEGERPNIVYYSATGNPDGEDTWPGKGQQGSPEEEERNRQAWARANGGGGGNTVWINVDNMGDPQLIHTMPHEIQHIQQGRMTEQYREMTPVQRMLIATGMRADPFKEQGSSIREVAMWENRPEIEYYWQPVEIDARRGGAEYVDGLTYEKWVELGGPEQP